MEKIKVIAQALDDLNIKDIKIYDMREKSPFFDYFILSTATNTRQLKAAITHIKDALAKETMTFKNIEGAQSDAWILMDAYDIIINIFTESERSYYNIEKMWMDTETISLESL